MKRILALLLALVLCMAVFAACAEGNTEQTTEANNGSNTESDTTDNSTGEGDGLNNALEYVHQLYKDIPEKTGASYDLVTKIIIGEDAYTVTWTVSSEELSVVEAEGKENTVTVVVPKATEDIPYTLTATVKDAAGNTLTKEYEKTVPAFKVNTYEEYAAAKEGDNLVVVGIVAGVNGTSLGNKYNHLFLVDETGKGGYYIYKMTDDPAAAGIKAGMTVSVTGTASPYPGMQEMKNGVAEIIDATIKEVPAVDITSVIENATAETSYAPYVGMLVTIKNVEIGNQELATETSQYLNFTKGSFKSYVRTYVTDFCFGATADEKTAGKTSIDTAHAEKFGWTANATGICVLYNSVPYLIPVGTDCFEYLSLVEKTPAEKVAIEKEALTLTEKANKNMVIELLTKGQFYNDVTITWTSDNAAAVVGENGLTVTLDKTAATAKITATITCGEATDTVEFTLEIAAKPTTSPVAIDTPAAGTAYKVYMVHPNADKNGLACYLTGKEANKPYYLATTEDSAEAADIFAEATEGGFHLYLMDGEKKIYLNIRENDGYVNNLYEETAQCVYTWDATLKTFVTKVGEDTYSFGMKKTSTYTTIEAKKVSAEDCAFAQFVTMVEAGPQIPASLAVGTPYYVYMVHPNADKEGLVCYLTGKEGNKEYYLASSDSILNAAAFYLEETEGGFHVYFMDGEKKIYLNIRANGDYVNNLYEETAQCVYTYDATLKTLVTKVGEDTYSFGMKKTSTYTTFEAKKVSAEDCAFANFVIWVGDMPEAEQAPDLGTVAGSITFADYANRTSFDKDSAEVWTSGDLKITHTKGSNALRDTVTSEDKQLRVYGKATLTVESTGIKKIVLTVDDSHSDSVGRLSSFTVEGTTTEVVNGKAIITLSAAANSVVITNTHSSQIRILSVEIYK